MTKVLKLYHGSTEKMDLQSGDAAGYQLKSWSPAIARPAYGRDADDVEEQMPITVTGASHNDLATKLQTFHEVQRLAEMFRIDRTAADPVWLHCQLENETGLRRAPVRSISGDFSASWYGATGIANKAEVSMVVQRGPYWERSASRSLPQWRPTATVAAYLYDYTAAGSGVGAHDIVGDVGARVDQFVIQYAADDLEKLWLGIRSVEKVSSPGSFQPLWEFEDSDATVSLGSRTTDSTASPGGAGNTKVQIPSGTTTWTEAWRQNLSGVSGATTAHYGKFLWLIRTKVSAGTWEIRLKYGYLGMAAGDFVAGPIVEVSETGWTYKEMGIQSIPLRNLQAMPNANFDEQHFQVQAFVRQTSGSGTFDLDCLTPVPIDEGFFKAYAAPEIGSGDFLYFGESPNGHWQASGKDFAAGYHMGTFAFEAVNFRLPPGDGRMVIVPMTEAPDVIRSDLYVNDSDAGKYYERWASLRGSE